MPHACHRCNAPVDATSARCPECGTELDPGRKDPLARAHGRPALADQEPVPASTPEVPASAHHFSLSDATPGPGPVAPSSSARSKIPPPKPRPIPPPPKPLAIPPRPSGFPPAQPSIASSPLEAVPDAEASKVQDWMTKMLSGSFVLEAAAPAVDAPADLREQATAPPHSDVYYPPLAVARPGPVAPPVADGPPLPDETPVAPPKPAGRARLVLQVQDTHGQWREWGPILASGLDVGRVPSSSDFPELSRLAVRHLRFRLDHEALVVDDLGSLNGVYMRLSRPAALSQGTRFRIGGYTLEFRPARSFTTVEAQVAEDGEELCTRDLEPLAVLDLIRPDGRPGLRWPITNLDATVIGREGPNAHIALTGDPAVSVAHAQIRPDDGGLFLLEDLKSRTGTFLKLNPTSPLQPGEVLLAGKVSFRVMTQPGR